MDKVFEAYDDLARRLTEESMGFKVSITLTSSDFDRHLFALEEKNRGWIEKVAPKSAKTLSDIVWFSVITAPGSEFRFFRQVPEPSIWQKIISAVIR